MSKTLAVFGATGTQGGSVINYVLNDPELSKSYNLRAIVRDLDSEKAREFRAKGADVVRGDATDEASLRAALRGVNTVYIMTVPAWGPDAVEAEYRNAKLIADIAVEQGVEYIIFSTLPSVTQMSGGKYTNVTPFDAKAKAEEYIRGLPVKSAFVSLGSFMENFSGQPFLAPQPAGDGTWVLSRPISSKAKLPLLYATGDTGKFVGAILAEPDKYEGRTFHAATALYSFDDIIAALSKHTGKTIKFKQVSFEEFHQAMPFAADLWVDGQHAQEEFGYFGPDQETLVAWAAKHARGRLTTFEEFLELNPYQLA